MRPLSFTAFAVFAAAALAAAPVAAQERHHNGGGGGGPQHFNGAGGPQHGGGHGGGGHGGGGWRHGGAGFAAPALIFGLGAAAIAAGVAGSQAEDCRHYERVYDDYGNYVGRRVVDEC